MELTWLLTRLLTCQMTWQLTSPFGPTLDPTRSTGQPGQWSDPTRSPVNRFTGRPDLVNGSTTRTRSTRPGQRVNSVNGQTRPGNRSTGSRADPTWSTGQRTGPGQPDPINISPADPVHALPRASPRAEPSGGA